MFCIKCLSAFFDLWLKCQQENFNIIYWTLLHSTTSVLVNFCEKAEPETKIHKPTTLLIHVRLNTKHIRWQNISTEALHIICSIRCGIFVPIWFSLANFVTKVQLGNGRIDFYAPYHSKWYRDPCLRSKMHTKFILLALWLQNVQRFL